MPRYIAFLRAINVGGHIVKMDHLRALFAALGFANVDTFIASGNVIFESKSKNTKALETQIEDHLHNALGYAVATFIRTDREVREIADYQPFPAAMLEQAVALNIAFLKGPLDETSKQALLGLKTAVDDFHGNGREVYWLCRIKQSDSKFSNALFERITKSKATFRGAKTVMKITAKYPVKSKSTR